MNPIPLSGAGDTVAGKGRDGDAKRGLLGADRGVRGDDGRRLEEEWLPRVFTIVAGVEREKS